MYLTKIFSDVRTFQNKLQRFRDNCIFMVRLHEERTVVWKYYWVTRVGSKDDKQGKEDPARPVCSESSWSSAVGWDTCHVRVL